MRFSLMMYSTCLKTDGSPCRRGSGRGAASLRGGANALTACVRRLLVNTVRVAAGKSSAAGNGTRLTLPR